jgi:hypothetical protein
MTFRTPLHLTDSQICTLTRDLANLRMLALESRDLRAYASFSVAIQETMLYVIDRLLYLLAHRGVDLQSLELKQPSKGGRVEWQGLLQELVLGAIARNVAADDDLRTFLLSWK